MGECANGLTSVRVGELVRGVSGRGRGRDWRRIEEREGEEGARRRGSEAKREW